MVTHRTRPGPAQVQRRLEEVHEGDGLVRPTQQGARRLRDPHGAVPQALSAPAVLWLPPERVLEQHQDRLQPPVPRGHAVGEGAADPRVQHVHSDRARRRAHRVRLRAAAADAGGGWRPPRCGEGERPQEEAPAPVLRVRNVRGARRAHADTLQAGGVRELLGVEQAPLAPFKDAHAEALPGMRAMRRGPSLPALLLRSSGPLGP
mmetsp:Transcript_11224/g.38235  ORF Transcript_11224/g.38235 Transcript_11224/m.38235 type:complete len:205 (-) Transcript_11224:162-776(-)